MKRSAADSPAYPFRRVFEGELREIQQRREEAGFEGFAKGARSRDQADAMKSNLAGIALSGGGIRSATFCLGLLQKLHEYRLLRVFDYLSTVSGGGYLGGWWSAWLARPQFSPADLEDPAKFRERLLDESFPLSVYLVEKFRESNRDLARRYAPDASIKELKEKLVEDLNKVIAGECIHTADRFKGVHLQSSTRELLDKYLAAKEDAGEGGPGGPRGVWLNRLLLEDAYPGVWIRSVFPPDEGIEPEREKNYVAPLAATTENGAPAGRAEGSMSAGIDPIHHLRLFANYLTPRTGFLSGDTWRAVAVVTRNLTMTWVMLLPLLVAVVLVGQLYFVVQDNSIENFVTYPLGNEVTDSGVDSSSAPPQSPTPEAREAHAAAIWARVLSAVPPLAVIGGWIVLMGVLWLLFTIEADRFADWIAVAVGLLSVAAVLCCVIYLYAPSIGAALYNWRNRVPFWAAVWLVGVVLLMAYVLSGSRRDHSGVESSTTKQWRQEVLRSRLTRAHAKLLAAFVLTAVVLALSGFGHELILYPRYFFNPDSPALKSLAQHLPWIGFLVAGLSGSIFTAIKAKPSNKEGKAKTREPSARSQLLLAITPTLVVVALAIFVAWLGHRLLQDICQNNPDINPLIYSTFFGVVLCFTFARFEMKFEIENPSIGTLGFATWLAFTLTCVGHTLAAKVVIGDAKNLLPLVIPALIILVVPVALLGLRVVNARTEKGRTGGARRVVLVVGCLAGAVALGLRASTWLEAALNDGTAGANQLIWFLVALTVATITGGLILFRFGMDRKSPGGRLEPVLFGKRPRNHGLWLLGSLCVVLVVAVDSAVHAAITHTGVSARSLWELVPFTTLPVCLAVLAGGLLFFRVAAIELTKCDTARERSKLLRTFSEIFKPYRQLIATVRSFIFRKPQKEGSVRVSVKWLWMLASICLCSVVVVGWIASFPSVQSAHASAPLVSSAWSLAGAYMGGVVVLFRTTLLRIGWRPDTPPAGEPVFKEKGWVRAHKDLFLWTMAGLCILVAAGTGWVARVVVYDVVNDTAAKQSRPGTIELATPIFVAIVVCITFVVFEMKWGTTDNRRSLWLLTGAYIVLAALLIVSLNTDGMRTASEMNPAKLVQAVIGLIAAALTWILGLGWMSDPNAYSMHLFYKARLVRAYLGASNYDRRRQGDKEITEAVAGDNVLVKDLNNYWRGAPYHLINTTLNLVAARDLATAQRSAATFVLSRRYCGSSRTGYRKTSRYMKGGLSLGTAIAISGAAASPNMGSRTPTAALAMLMTILNVRLGYWAPTPKSRVWNLARARLWPFYLMREFLSNTNDVSDYCYLTDGGHFDNTGLYSLVERGCRYVVVADCGADPDLSFSDLGNAVRRCRIDFGAEINLNITGLKKHAAFHSDQHFVEGEIVYSREHVESLGWPGDLSSEAARTGRIILFKPSLLGDDRPDEPADVRQYSIENEDFPQQTTAKQWFDEAQFESYRQLGQVCAHSALARRPAASRIKNSSGFVEKIKASDVKALFEGEAAADPRRKPKLRREGSSGRASGASL